LIYMYIVYYLFQESCGSLADKYIEYDSVVILVDLILLDKRAYRHLLYNCNLKPCWKLIIILWLVESFRNFSLCENNAKYVQNWKAFQYHFNGYCNLYLILFKTAFAHVAFIFIVILLTEIKWYLQPNNSNKCSVTRLTEALVIGGAGKLLGLLEITWRHVFEAPHHFLIFGYTLLCLITAYL
ncbi:PREDICTED: protein ARV1, partial [Habropoda laboriosa]|uniref:protein ARV1 n=1 Tax=Habropoda laboriosa TaxID=597456 RepID=UPI00083CDDC1